MASSGKKEEEFNPYPGLRSYTPEENEYFFGRESESLELTEKLLQNRFVAVTGASGSGKSSLVQCGLLPRLRSNTIYGTVNWHTFIMKPGSDPFLNLCNSLTENILFSDQIIEKKEEILKLLKENTDGLAEVLKMLPLGITTKSVLFVDQFEELFRYRSSRTGIDPGTETSGFINLLTNTITRNTPDFYLVIALRSDLISECAHFRSFTNLLNHSNFLVSRMNRENFREVIEGPVRKAGAEIENNLVEQIIREINDRSDQLPVLQHALMRTWIHWKELDEPSKPIGSADYNSIGTMNDAISRHADEIFEGLDEEGKRICEKLFKFITGKGSDNKGTRYPSNLKTIRSAIGCNDDELKNVIEKFRSPSLSILTPQKSVQLTDDSIIDLLHESLINLWDRLRNWVEEESFSIQMYLQLSEASALYQQGKTGLLKQPDLQIAIKWREENKPTLKWAEKYNPAYERAMVYLRTSEREFLESEELKAKHNRWRLKRIRIISSVLGGIAIITAVTMIAAIVSRSSAEKHRKLAEKEKDQIMIEKAATEKYATVALQRSVRSDSIALAATRKAQMERLLRISAEDQVITAGKEAEYIRKQSRSAVQAGLLANMTADSAIKLKNETQRLRMISVAKSMSLRSLQVPQGNGLQALLAYQGYLFNKRNNGNRNDADIYAGLYNIAKQKGSNKIKSFSTSGSNIRSFTFIPGRNEFFTSGSDGKVLKWNLENKDKSVGIIYSGNELIDIMAVSPQAKWLACGVASNAIKMIPLNGTDSEFELKGHSGKIRSLIFSFDGKFLYSAALDGKILKWDLSARTSIDLATGMMKITSIDISTNGKYFAGISEQGKALVWNPEQTSEKFTIESAGKKIKSIRIKPDEEKIAVGYDDGSLELWNLSTREKIREFIAHSGEVNNISFNRKSSQMATSGSDGALKIWDSEDVTNPPISFNDNEGIVIEIEFSPDGEVILSGTIEGKPKIIARPVFAETLATDGCSYVTRNFTPDEWLAYVGKDITYEKTCLGADYKIKIKEVR